MSPARIPSSLFHAVLLAGFCALAAQAVPQYTVSNGSSIIDVHVDPYFLDPGDDVIDFYSYGSPQSSSANTGFEQLNTALIYLTLDDQGNYGLVTVMDKWGGGGGSASLSYSGLPLGSTASLNDDPGDPHSFNPATGSGTNSWNWSNCCTDGAAWSLPDSNNFQITMNYTFNSGLDTLRFITFDPCDQSQLLFFDLDVSQPVVLTATDGGQPLPDCNDNGAADFCDISDGTSQDCNSNGIPDECEEDCNGNGLHDSCDIATGASLDCNLNGIPDECETDCNANGIPDDCDIASGSSADCNANGIPDDCEIDCNLNGIPDDCDIALGTSQDCDQNGVPDECDPDCDDNGTPDACEADCDGNGTADVCEWTDCNNNGQLDICDILSGASLDCNANGLPDECEDGYVDCNVNGIWDLCDIAMGTSLDEDQNGVPDECEGTAGANDRPVDFGLLGNYPNPFNPSTVIEFGLAETSPVRLAVYSVDGALVQVLVNGMQERGLHRVVFDADRLASGVYLYRLESEGRIDSRKMLLVR